jgi:hypothetical protein
MSPKVHIRKVAGAIAAAEQINLDVGFNVPLVRVRRQQIQT